MKISHFNTFPYGGAATAAIRLNQQLRKSSHDSQLYYSRSEKDIVQSDSIQKIETCEKTVGRLASVVANRIKRARQKEIYRLFNEHVAMRPPGVETFSMARLPNETRLNWPEISSDVVHLHWISFFADYPSFFDSIPARIPIVWTLHDMNAFTGGCHYSAGCERFKTGCGSCSQVTNSGPRDVSVDSFKAKRRALANRLIFVVSPSQWMLDLAQQSPIWPKQTSFHQINLGFDLKKMHPIEKQKARELLGIKSDAVLIGFGADDVNNQRKGMSHLLSSLAKLTAREPVECLTFGAGELPEVDTISKFHHQGFVNSAERLRLIYSAADLVVVPSREDNQPQVGLEAMACGTPVVAFNAGGIPEYVHHGKTGLLASVGNEEELAKQISWMVGNGKAREEMGVNARSLMEKSFEVKQQTDKHIQLYENAALLGQRSKAA
jgi:glycosyltransferase involved in cell wall biosynthesis